MAQSLTAESNPRSKVPSRTKLVSKVVQYSLKEHSNLTEETVDRKGGQDQSATDSNPQIMLELSKSIN